MKIRNNKGANTVPCGTPERTSVRELCLLSRMTRWERLLRKFFIHTICFSKNARQVSETPSLWTDFLWPYYHAADARYTWIAYWRHMEKLSKSCFPDHVTPPTLVKLTEYCSNVTYLQPQDEKISQVLQYMGWLLRLDIQSNLRGILHILESLCESNINLKELTLYVNMIWWFTWL